MTVDISSNAEEDLIEGGIHAIEYGYHRALSKRFPFCIYYRVDGSLVTVVAVLDARRDPLWIRQRLEQDRSQN